MLQVSFCFQRTPEGNRLRTTLGQTRQIRIVRIALGEELVPVMGPRQNRGGIPFKDYCTRLGVRADLSMASLRSLRGAGKACRNW